MTMKAWNPNTDDDFNRKPRFSYLRPFLLSLLIFVIALLGGGFGANNAQAQSSCVTIHDFTVEQIKLRATAKITTAPLAYGKGHLGETRNKKRVMMYGLILYFAGEPNGVAALFLSASNYKDTCQTGNTIIVPIDELKKEIGAELIDNFNKLHASKS